jgi:hypothetical protein
MGPWPTLEYKLVLPFLVLDPAALIMFGDCFSSDLLTDKLALRDSSSSLLRRNRHLPAFADSHP